MYTENYFNEDLLSEDLLSEDLVYESYDESYDEAAKRKIKRPINPRVRPGVAQRSNFGKTLNGNANEYVSKSELQTSLDSISRDVNELKKSTIETNSSLKALDAKHTELAKIDAKKNDNQTAVLRNMQMNSLITTLFNQTKFDVNNLKLADDGKNIAEKVSSKTVTTDTMLPILMSMMSTQGGSGGGEMNMMLPLVLLMNKDGGSAGGGDNTMLLVMMMMMGGMGKK
jgi:hypothetical protein